MCSFYMVYASLSSFERQWELDFINSIKNMAIYTNSIQWINEKLWVNEVAEISYDTDESTFQIKTPTQSIRILNSNVEYLRCALEDLRKFIKTNWVVSETKK